MAFVKLNKGGQPIWINSDRIAYFEGVEYLVRIHGATRTLELLNELNALSVESGARLLLPINPALMDPTTVDQLTAQFRSA
jgi:hypothetical protein